MKKSIILGIGLLMALHFTVAILTALEGRTQFGVPEHHEARYVPITHIGQRDYIPATVKGENVLLVWSEGAKGLTLFPEGMAKIGLDPETSRIPSYPHLNDNWQADTEPNNAYTAHLLLNASEYSFERISLSQDTPAGLPPGTVGEIGSEAFEGFDVSHERFPNRLMLSSRL